MKQAAKIGCGCFGLGLVSLIGLAILGALLSADEQAADEVVLAASPELASSKVLEREKKPDPDLADSNWLDDEEDDLAAEAVRARFPLLPADFEMDSPSPDELNSEAWDLVWEHLELWLAGVAMEESRWELESGEGNRCMALMRKYQARAKELHASVLTLPVRARLAMPSDGLHRCITCTPTAMEGCALGANRALRLLLEHDRIKRTP